MDTSIAIVMDYAVRTVLTLWSHDQATLHAPGATASCQRLAACPGWATRADLLALYDDALHLSNAPETDLAGEARALLAWLLPLMAADRKLAQALHTCATARR